MIAAMGYRVPLLAASALAVAAVWSACGDPAGTGPTPSGPPELTCPANVTVADVPALGQAVTYATPAATGGTLPVTTTCAPASGTTFPIGTTSVACTAKDAINRSAVCSFSVTLASSHLGAMSFVAFGDSQTAGENGDDADPGGFPVNYQPACAVQPQATAAMRRLQSIRPAYIDVANSYPTQLVTLLTSQFAGQSFTMDNEGFPGETAFLGFGRLVSGCPNGQSVFARDHPDVFLLLEGINDIGGDQGPDGNGYQPTLAEQRAIVGYLQSDVAAAVGSSVPYTFVSTILPVNQCPFETMQTCRVGDAGDPTVANEANASIDSVNELIRAGIPGAIIVDGNSAFKLADPTLASLIGEDGLHPTPAGYGVLARAFLAAISARVSITTLHRTHR